MLVQNYGLTHYDKSKATTGFTLFSRNFSNQVWLINMDGEVVHEWTTTGGSTHTNYLRPNGNLFVCERVDEGPKVVSGKSGRMREYDWDGNLVWEHIDDHQHHDARRLENGNAVKPSKLAPLENVCLHCLHCLHCLYCLYGLYCLDRLHCG